MWTYHYIYTLEITEHFIVWHLRKHFHCGCTPFEMSDVRCVLVDVFGQEFGPVVSVRERSTTMITGKTASSYTVLNLW